MVSNTPVETSRRGLAELALATGLASVLCGVLHLIIEVGWLVFAAMGLGILGIVFGAIALAKRQPKNLSVTGLIAGILGFLYGAAWFIFALIIVGAIMA